METTTTATTDEYEMLLDSMRVLMRSGNRQLFTTSADGLFEAYLSGFPESERQYHNCNTCRRFIESYGGLVRVGDDGELEPAFWPVNVPTLYGAAVARVVERVLTSTLTGVFYSKEPLWGVPATPHSKKHSRVFTHLSVPNPRVFSHALLTPFQAMAEKREERGAVLRALAEFPRPLVAQAVKILEADALFRGEKTLGPARFLLDLHNLRAEASSRSAREALTWRMVAEAPAGFCHPRSSMVGTLLEDLAAGKSVEEAARSFAAKMHPLRYQRPQAAPSEGNITQAEALVEKMSLRDSLRRRFAQLDEVEALWIPTTTDPAPAQESGVFSHLRPVQPGAAPLEFPESIVTFAKFERDALLTARSLELLTPFVGNYCALVTAAVPSAPPILQWDREGRRNPVSWYLYVNGSPTERWGLEPRTWVRVSAICARPCHWYGNEHAHEGPGRLFILDGAQDTTKGASLALFPEILRSELHSIRSTIEAFSRAGRIEGADEASACGIAFGSRDRAQQGIRVRVTDFDGDRRVYHIDRWE